MARPEEPLNPDDGPVQRFAWDLRQLRLAAGKPAYRVMAAQVFRSATALSEAARGRELPSRQVTLAYIQACGGDEGEWGRRWDSLAAEIGQGPVTSGAVAGEDSVDLGAPSKKDEGRRGWRPGWVAGVVGGVAVAFAAAWFGLVSGGGSTSASADDPRGKVRAAASMPAGSAGSVSAVRGDGGDPRASGCMVGSVTLGDASVIFPGNHYIGQLELRYSPRCGTAWGRFTPSPGMDALPGTSLISISAVRPADHSLRKYEVTYDGQPAFGDMLFAGSACVSASVVITQVQPAASGVVGGEAARSAHAATECLR